DGAGGGVSGQGGRRRRRRDSPQLSGVPGVPQRLVVWGSHRTPMIEIPVELASRSYPILVGAGALDRVGPELRKRRVGRKTLLVTDPDIALLHAEPVARSRSQ